MDRREPKGIPDLLAKCCRGEIPREGASGNNTSPQYSFPAALGRLLSYLFATLGGQLRGSGLAAL